MYMRVYLFHLALCRLGKFACLWIFLSKLFQKNLSGIPSDCQTVWIQIRPDVLSGLIWDQTVCKGNQQMTKVATRGERVKFCHNVADIDECSAEEKKGCQQLCINTDGSFHCDCQEGYHLQADQQSCLKTENHTGLYSSLADKGSKITCLDQLRHFYASPCGDWSWNIFYGHSLPSADSRRAFVSFWQRNVHNTG